MATLLLDRDWLLIKTDFLMHAARHPDLVQCLVAHRAQLRTAIEDRLSSSAIELPNAIGTVGDAACVVVAAYDGVSI
ncbi:hypothetical protein [Mycobacterium lepromatosis]|uniref:hypothetical protein n=1 Tax=Mycobacterium lepromatosis TaxID=480418 RepID=UPI000A73248E|nr:hypothetical protein [Mycobacterium lepromatosis]